MFERDHLREEIEKGFVVVQADPSKFSTYGPTGEKYMTIGHQIDGDASQPGTVDEGKSRELGFDEETAYWCALGAFREYAEDKTGKLYWRDGPLFEWGEDGHRCNYWIRLLISDKPILAYDAA